MKINLNGIKPVILSLACVLLVLCTATTCKAQMRAVQITKEVPVSAANQIASAGFDTVVIYYTPYRAPEDPSVIKHLTAWGEAAKKLNLNIYVRIETGPPIDAVAETKTVKYRAAASDDGYPQTHKPAPASSEFWQTAIFPKIDKLAAMSSRMPLKGVFLNFTNHVRVSFDADTYAEFLKSKEPDTDASTIKPLDRKPHIMASGWLEDYEKFQQDRIAAFTSEYLASLKEKSPDFQVQMGTYDDNLVHRGFAAALKQSLSGSREYIYPLHGEKDIEKNDSAEGTWIPALSVREFTPEDISAMAVALGLWKSGFIVVDAESLWIPLKQVTISEWPLGTTDEYMKKLSESKSAGEGAAVKYRETVKRLSGRVVAPHNGGPRIALIYSSYMGNMYRDVFDLLASRAGLAFDKYENTKVEKLFEKLDNYDAIITAPGYNAVNSKKFPKYGPDILKFVKNGGLLVILDATIPQQTEWLGKADPELALAAEERPGLKFKWADTGFKMLGYPSRITKFTAGKYHFKEAATGWRQIAKDNEDKSFVVQRLYGEGMIVAFAGFDIDPEFMVNGWEYMLKVKDRFDVKIDQHLEAPKYGNTKAGFIATTFGPERKLKVKAEILSQGRKIQSAEKQITITQSGGVRFTVPFNAVEPGLHRITLNFIDEGHDRLDRRESFSFLVPEPFEFGPEKSYYTSENAAVVRILCNKTAGCGKYDATVSLNAGSKSIVAKKKSADKDVVYYELPISALKPGSYKVTAKLKEQGQKEKTLAAEIKKLAPGPAIETKLLNFRGGLLEVNGKPFFPLGIYSIPPENMKDLVESGVNAMIYYGNTVDAERDINKAMDGLGLKYSAYPIYPHKRINDDSRETLVKEIEEKAKNNNLFMWYLADEPEGFGQSPELIGDVFKLVKSVDPYRPQAIVMMSPEHYSKYTDATDIFMFDRYPTPTGAQDTVGLFAQRSVQAVYGRKPVIAIPQAFSWQVWDGTMKEGAEHRPNYAEMKNSAIESIAADVKGIIYWAYTASRYDIRKYPEHEKAFRKLISELAGLIDVMSEPNAYLDIAVEPDFKGIDWGAKRHGGKLYIFAYNGDPDVKDKVAFTLPEAYKDKTIEVYGENRTIKTAGRSFTDSFGIFETHIYIITEK